MVRPSEGASGDARMYGKLGSVSLNDVLQLLGMTQRTATVHLDWNGQHGLIFFRDGVLLHATAGSAEGERALVKLMSWEHADFVIEDGLEGDPPGTISKKVDAVMLDVMTRLDEGWVPEMTPFPMLDRLTTSAAVLDQKVRLAVRTPPRPKRAPRRTKPVAAALAVALALVLAAALGLAFFYQSSELGELPPLSLAPSPAPVLDGPRGIAADILEASLDGEKPDGIVALAAHGISLTPEAKSLEGSRDATVAATPDAAPKTAELGELLVVAEPWAAVAVDGVERGETPLTAMSLSAGSHEVVLSNPNFVGVIRDRVQIGAGETVQRRYSFHESGSLRILVKPWADVYVDGRHAGQTPLGALRVPAGTHTIVLRHPELGEKTAVVEVTRDRESVLEVEM